MTHFVRIAFLFYSFKVFQTTQKLFPFVVRLISLFTPFILAKKNGVFFKTQKMGRITLKKKKNVHFLSGGVLRRRLNKGVVGFLKKNLKMRPPFFGYFLDFCWKTLRDNQKNTRQAFQLSKRQVVLIRINEKNFIDWADLLSL